MVKQGKVSMQTHALKSEGKHQPATLGWLTAQIPTSARACNRQPVRTKQSNFETSAPFKDGDAKERDLAQW